MHLFVDISSHGFGHLALGAPVLNALAKRLPGLRLTVRSALPPGKLRERIRAPFELVAAASDFGYRMHDALRIDYAASAAAYRQAHAGWEDRVAAEAAYLAELAPHAVLTNVAYLPLAGAAHAGIPAAALCCLNWADLFAHYFGGEDWAAPIHAQMLAAYRSAQLFLRPTPGMPMPDLGNVVPVGPIAGLGQGRRLGLADGERAVLVALGGIAHRLPVEDWPRLPGIRWLLAQDWQCTHPDAIAFETLGLSFTDLLRAVDAVITKPGYGTFTEAACNGTPVLYQRRPDWPEQDYLIAWLNRHGRCREVDAATLAGGSGLAAALAGLWSQAAKPAPAADGAAQATDRLAAMLGRDRPAPPAADAKPLI